MSFPTTPGQHSFSKTQRYARSSYLLAELDNGDQLLVQVRTGHSAGRKVYYSTIGNVRREAPRGDGQFSAEISHPMDDRRIAMVDAGARYSEKNLKAAHEAAIAAVKASTDPAVLRFLSPEESALVAD